MNKIPAVKGKDIIRALKKVGWEVDHVRGSHHQCIHKESGKRITIAVHAGKEWPRGLLSSLLKDIGISNEDFRKLL